MPPIYLWKDKFGNVIKRAGIICENPPNGECIIACQDHWPNFPSASEYARMGEYVWKPANIEALYILLRYFPADIVKKCIAPYVSNAMSEYEVEVGREALYRTMQVMRFRLAEDAALDNDDGTNGGRKIVVRFYDKTVDKWIVWEPVTPYFFPRFTENSWNIVA